MGGDELVPIPIEDLPDLQAMYKRDLPQHEIVYNWLQNYIDWLDIDPKLKDFAVFSLNGTWRENGTFVIEDRYQLFFHTLLPSTETLTRALDLVDWDYSWKISACSPQHRPSVLEIIQKHRLELQYDFCTETRYLRKEEALKFDVTVPEQLELRPLTVEDAVRADALWPNRAMGSGFLLKRLALWNASVGLYDVSSNELLAWCFRLQSGAHGVLQVPDQHRRKGYGSIVAQALAHKVATMGYNPYAFIVTTNDPSRELFRKLGFQNVGTMHWTRNIARKLVEWER